MEAADTSKLLYALLFEAHGAHDHLRQLHDEVVQVHGGTPLRLALRQQLEEQVASISERRRTIVRLGHHDGRLEGELIPQQNVKVEGLRRRRTRTYV